MLKESTNSCCHNKIEKRESTEKKNKLKMFNMNKNSLKQPLIINNNENTLISVEFIIFLLQNVLKTEYKLTNIGKNNLKLKTQPLL